MVHERIEHESSELLNALRYQENRNEVFKFYLHNQTRPTYKDNELLNRGENHHPVRDHLKSEDRAHPLESRHFRKKEIHSYLSDNDVDRSAAVSA